MLQETPQGKIDRLNRELNDAKNQQQNCSHTWSETKSDPESTFRMEVRPGDFSECHGSDYYPAFDKVPVTKQRWSRTCQKCGKTEYTYDNVQPVKGGPQFRN